MSVHYKFKSALEYDTVTFDGLHISVRDLKNAIIQQKRIGKNTDFDLQVTNAQTKEVYEDEETLIPKNTSLLIARIPLAHTNKSKNWEGYGNESTPVARSDEGGPAAKAVDLSSLDASEDDKIRAMMSQSTQDYDPSNYMKIRGANQVGTVPPNYRCYKCHQSGHWIKDCPLSQGPEPIEIKKSTGIPRSFMVPVDGPQVQGAMMTPNGSYAVPVLDHQTYTQKQHPAPPPQPPEEQPDIPEDLICSICSGLLSDAVMIPCCGNSFCDECIRGSLLESEEHECPDCHERDISPGTLIPNRYLRNSVANFKNTTGYIKKPTFRQQMRGLQSAGGVQIVSDGDVIELEKREPDVKAADPKSDKEGTPEPIRADSAEKTVISEADSTELVKSNLKLDPAKKELEVPDVKKEAPTQKPELPASGEGPPGVSPRRDRSPRREKSPRRSSSKRSSHPSSNGNGRNPRSPRNSRDMSPRRHGNRRGSPFNSHSRVEERAGTPTVDEPRNSLPNNGNYGSGGSYQPGGGPPGVLPPMMGMPPPHMQGPPPSYPQGQPPPGVFPTQGPPPNFRLPPPGSNPPAPYMGPYNAPLRPMFDHSRPPLQGPPPSYGGYPPRSRSRDYGPSRMRGRTPPGIIDDPLEAFNRMLREKDERDRRTKQRKGLSYSRSSSRSYSRSPKRGRSRSPGRRRSRSRSRSFSMSRSRSRSFSPSPRNTPYREYSPRHASPRRRPPSRYRSPLPIRSPTRYRYKDQGGLHMERSRGDREYERHPPRERERERERERPYSRDRDYNGGYYERERIGDSGGGRWGGNMRHQGPPMQDNYYGAAQMQELPQMHHQPPTAAGNRYQRDYQPYKNEPHHIQPLLPPHHLPPRRYEDIAPPGTDQPPIPGEELPPRYDDRYPSYNPDGKGYDGESRVVATRERRDERKREGKSPAKASRQESPDKHRKRKHEDKKETSEDEKGKKSKDKKKKKEKREQEKKKRKEKKEKHEKKRDEKKREKVEVVKPVEVPSEKHVEEKPQRDKDEKLRRNQIDEDKLRKNQNDDEKTKRNPEETKLDDLYSDDLLSEGVDTKVVESYGKLQEAKTPEMKPLPDEPEEGEYPQESETSKDEDVLDLHANELELKSELDKDILAPLPEKSKWEIDDELSPTIEAKYEGKQDRSGKVTNEVLKRAENAIFAKAINAIRPIEIKKISRDRAKLYSDQKETMKLDDDHLTLVEDVEMHPQVQAVKIESEVVPKPRLSVKERLGVKVDDLDRIVKVSYDRNRSRSLSPLSKRARDERVHGRERGRYDRNPSHRREHENRKEPDNRKELDNRKERKDHDNRREHDRRRTRSKSHTRKEEKNRKRTRSPSASKDHKHKKKDKKQRREKVKKHKREEKDELKEETKDPKPKLTTERRKPTLDEANFEPDYDLDTESEKEEKIVLEEEPPRKKKFEEGQSSEKPQSLLKSQSLERTQSLEKTRVLEKTQSLEKIQSAKVEKEKREEKDKKEKKDDKEKRESSSSDSSESSSEDEKRKKKHRKHKKKRSRKESTSSTSSSDSDSSDEERERKRKKHKRKQKKKKRSKHK